LVWTLWNASLPLKIKVRSREPPSSSGGIVRTFSQSRLQAALARWSCRSEPNVGFLPSPFLELVLSQLRIRTAIESANTQNRPGELPMRLLADSN